MVDSLVKFKNVQKVYKNSIIMYLNVQCNEIYHLNIAVSCVIFEGLIWKLIFNKVYFWVMNY